MIKFPSHPGVIITLCNMYIVLICISLFWLQLFKIVLVYATMNIPTYYYIRLSQLWFTMLLMFMAGLQNIAITKFFPLSSIFTTEPQEKIIQCSVQYIKFTSILLVSCWKKNLPTMHSNIWTASIHFFQIFRQDVRTCQKAVGIHLLHIYVFSPFYLLILGLGRYHIKIPTAILKKMEKMYWCRSVPCWQIWFLAAYK